MCTVLLCIVYVSAMPFCGLLILIGSMRVSTLETFVESDSLPWMESTDQI